MKFLYYNFLIYNYHFCLLYAKILITFLYLDFVQSNYFFLYVKPIVLR